MGHMGKELGKELGKEHRMVDRMVDRMVARIVDRMVDRMVDRRDDRRNELGAVSHGGGWEGRPQGAAGDSTGAVCTGPQAGGAPRDTWSRRTPYPGAKRHVCGVTIPCPHGSRPSHASAAPLALLRPLRRLTSQLLARARTHTHTHTHFRFVI